MSKNLNVGIIDYLNVKPLLYGITSSDILHDINITTTYPSKLAEMLLRGEVDLGIVPVAIIPEMPEWQIVSDYCIGCNGAVATVCLFSEVPVNRIETVLLDYQSKTSVALAKILLKQYWKVTPEFIAAEDESSLRRINGTTAALIIGDRAFVQRKKSTYIFDLGQAWKEYTGLPFVFAAWIANKPIPDEFIQRFNEANALGLKHIDKVIFENRNKWYDLNHYYKYNVNYIWDEKKKEGLTAFLSMLNQVPLTL